MRRSRWIVSGTAQAAASAAVGATIFPQGKWWDPAVLETIRRGRQTGRTRESFYLRGSSAVAGSMPGTALSRSQDRFHRGVLVTTRRDGSRQQRGGGLDARVRAFPARPKNRHRRAGRRVCGWVRQRLTGGGKASGRAVVRARPAGAAPGRPHVRSPGVGGTSRVSPTDGRDKGPAAREVPAAGLVIPAKGTGVKGGAGKTGGLRAAPRDQPQAARLVAAGAGP